MTALLEKLRNIPVVLGSQSPRRKELLAKLDIDFVVDVREVDEYVDRSLMPVAVVEAIAKAKLDPFVADESYVSKLVIVADTLVADKSGEVLGKPGDLEEAKEVLRRLSGDAHAVHTAVGIYYQGVHTLFVETTKVKFVALDDDEIDYYADRYYPLDKAGSYGIQEWIGRMGVAHITGSYENVVGLPTARLYHELKRIIVK